jgi:tetratricopeptide (TPR) repeat protein
VPIDRDAALKRAEKLLRQGKLDGAIEEYVRLVEDQPKDWNSINALGDLYGRAGDTERAAAQFTRIADYLYGEGFYPKAAALYKKALKVRPDHEPTLQRLAEVATQQGLLADATQYRRQLARQRRDRGDGHGAAECLVQLAGLDPDDAEALAAGAGAAEELGDSARAAGLFKQAAAAFAKHHRLSEALDARGRAAALDPSDSELRAQLAREFVEAGLPERAREFLTRESAGDNPDLIFVLAKAELAAGNEADGRALLTRAVMIAPERHGDVVAIADALVADGRVESAYGCIEVVCDAALLAGDWDAAIDALRRFVGVRPHLRQGVNEPDGGAAHIGALSRLVEVSIDAGRDDVLREAQGALADAYLDAGRAQEARVIAEDLVACEPDAEAHRGRLRRALEALGVTDVEEILAGPVGVESLLPEPLDLTDLESLDVAPAAATPPIGVPQTSPPVQASPVEDAADLDPIELNEGEDDDEDDEGEGRIVLEALEIDLSEIVASIKASASVTPPAPAATPPARPPAVVPTPVPPPVAEAAAPASLPDAPEAEAPVAPPPEPVPDLEAVFASLRAKALSEEHLAAARAQYDRGLGHLTAGRLYEAVLDLQAAARVPSLRFQAAAALGRIHLSRGELHPGVEWLERAVEAPAASPEEGLAVLYELADALERMGEEARSLAVLIELDTHAANYRDVRARIGALTGNRIP